MTQKGLEMGLEELEIGGRIEIIPTTALLRSIRLLRRVLEIWGKPTVTKTPMKNHRLTTTTTTMIIITSKCNKLAQKEYTIRHDKVIHRELCKKVKFDNTNKWYKDNTESALKNDTHKLLWYFEIEMDHLIEAWRPDLIIIRKMKKWKKKRTCQMVDFAVLADHRENWKKVKRKINTWTLPGNW